MRRTRLLLVTTTTAVATAAVGLTAGVASTSAAPAPVVTLPSGSDVHGLAAPVVLRCTTPTTAALTLTAAVPRSRSVVFSLTVDGRTVRSGKLVSKTGALSLSAPVTAGKPHTAALTVAGKVVARTAPGKGVSIACARKGQPAAAPAGPARTNAKSFALNRNQDGSVTRWNPCAGPISVRVNPAHAPAGGVDDARAALQKVGAATGLSLSYAGATDFVPTKANEDSRPADIVIAWAPRGTGAGKSDYYSGGAVGVGAWNATGSSADGSTWEYRISSGAVVLDPAVKLGRGFGTGGTTGALLLHELAHVMGLGHVSDKGQVMYPSLLPTTLGSYGAGDLAGLAAVGAKQGCTGTPAAA